MYSEREKDSLNLVRKDIMDDIFERYQQLYYHLYQLKLEFSTLIPL